MALGPGQPGLEPGLVAIVSHNRVRVGIPVQDAQHQHASPAPARFQCDRAEAHPAHRFVASQCLPSGHALESGVHDRLWPVEAAAWTGERLQLGEKGVRRRAVAFGTQHGVGHCIGPVPAFVKGQGGPDHDAVPVGVDPVQEGGYVTVIAHPVGRAAIEGDGGGGGHGQRL